jgi:hypothetical protein
MQFTIGITLFGIGFSGDIHQRRLVTPCREMTVNRVVTKIGLTADEPPCKWRLAEIKHLIKGTMPMDALRLFRPERLTILDGTSMKIGVRAHIPSSNWPGRRYFLE